MLDEYLLSGGSYLAHNNLFPVDTCKYLGLPTLNDQICIQFV